MFWRISTFVAVFLCAAVALAGKARTWTSADGRTMEAEFVRELDGDVTFIKDGKLIVIKLEKLSAKDQQAVKDLSAGKEPEEDPFTTPPAVTPSEEVPAEKPPENNDKPKKQIVIQTRTWTDRFGNKSSGKFIRVDGNDVVMKAGTKVLTVAFANLSDGDQEYVREILTSQGKEDAIPSATPPTGGPVGDGFPPAGGGIMGPGVPNGIGRGPVMRPPAAPGGGIPGGAPQGPGGSSGVGRGPIMRPPEAPGGGIPGGAPQGPGGTSGGPGRGTGVGIGIGMPPGIRPPVSTGPAIGSNPGMGPMGMGPMGPMGTGFPGSISDPGGMMGASGVAGAGGGMSAPGIGSARLPLPETGGGSGAMGGPAGMMGAGMGPGMGPGSFPGSRMPAIEPASVPQAPTMQIEETFECSKCKAKLTKLEAAGSSCPRCSAAWGFKQDQFGNKTMTAAGRSQIGTVAAVIVIFVILGVVVFIALFVGIIVAIVKAATAGSRSSYPPPPMPQQRYY